MLASIFFNLFLLFLLFIAAYLIQTYTPKHVCAVSIVVRVWSLLCSLSTDMSEARCGQEQSTARGGSAATACEPTSFFPLPRKTRKIQ